MYISRCARVHIGRKMHEKWVIDLVFNIEQEEYLGGLWWGLLVATQADKNDLPDLNRALLGCVTCLQVCVSCCKVLFVLFVRFLFVVKIVLYKCC